MIGKQILHYHIQEELGRGGMGIVYKAKDTRLDRTVAIKFLPRQIANNAGERERFKVEARAAAALNHANIATIYAIEEVDSAAGDAESEAFIVMEYIDGQELRDAISTEPFPVDKVSDIAMQIADGLRAAHKKGIVHRDIKSSNIMLTNAGQIKIMDFGLAKMGRDLQLTRQGTTLGTTAYMSPEQARGEQVDQRSDIWSFGVVLYEMLTGALPFRSEYEHAIMYSIMHEEPEELIAQNPQVSEGLATIVTRALTKNREQRYQQMDEVLADLRALQGGSTISAPAVQSQPAASAVTAAKPKFFGLPRRLAAGLAVVAVVALLLLMLLPGSRQALLQRLGLSAVPDVRHIAVLPFTNIGGDPSNQALCDGLVETLTSKLSQLQHFAGAFWVVPATEIRSSKVTSASEAQKLFGSNLVITGSLQRYDGGLRVIMSLVDAKSQRQLGSQIIDDPMTSTSALQDEAVVRLAGMLNLELQPESRRLLAAGGTSAPGAYEFYLQGRGFLQRYDQVDNIHTAIEFFTRAIDADPQYALAHAALGEAYLRLYNATRDVKWFEPALASCRQAVTLDSLLAPGHITMGLILTESGQHAQALREFEKALRLEPKNDDAYRGKAKALMGQGKLPEAEAIYKEAIAMKPDYWGGYNDLGVFYSRHARYEEAIGQFKQVIELTPLNAKGYRNLGAMYFYLERRQEAIQAFRQALDIKPDYSLYSNMATLYYAEKQYAEAARMYEKALELSGSDYRVWSYLGSSYKYSRPPQPEKSLQAYQRAKELAEARLAINPTDATIIVSLAAYHQELGDRDKALALLRQGIALQSKEVSVIFSIGHVYEQLGQRDEALQWLGKALVEGYSLVKMENVPGLEKIIADERFRHMVQKLTPEGK